MRVFNRRWALACLILAPTLGFSQNETPKLMAIRDAKIYPVSGSVIEKGTVLVRNGLIEALGANVTVPADAWVVDGKGLTVYPGLIDALSNWGVPAAAAPAGRGAATGTPNADGPRVQFLDDGGPEERPATNSWITAADQVQPNDRVIAAARQAGYTSAVVFPASGIFAGQGSLLNLAGEKSGEMVVASPVGQYLSFASRGFTQYPGSLMGVYAYVRQVYLDAAHYKSAKAMYAQNPRGLQRPAYDRALEGVLESPRILMPANRAVEMARHVNFGKELGQPFLLYGGLEAWKAADQLAKAKVPMLINLKWPERDRDVDPEFKESLKVLENREMGPKGAAALAKAGVPFAFYSGQSERPGEWKKSVKRVLEGGLTKEQALRAMTLSVAEIYGVADRLGSLEAGKIANLTVTDGDLFEDKTKVKFVVIDGKKFDPAPEAEPEAPAGGRPAPAAKPTPNQTTLHQAAQEAQN